MQEYLFSFTHQFTIILHYPSRQPHPLTVILRGHILTVRKNQARYLVRGTTGTFLKNGVDPQEDQLKAGIKTSDAEFGYESPEIAATLELRQEDGVILVQRSVLSVVR